MGHEIHIRVDPRHRAARALDLGLIDLSGRVQNLSLEVRQRHRVVIDHAQRADPRCRQIQDRRRTQPPGADHQNPRCLELLLPRPADLVQHDVAGVAFQFFR